MLIAATGILAGPVAAQGTVQTKEICLKAQRLPYCKIALLPSAGVHGLVGAAENGGPSLRGIVDWGMLVNVGKRSSIGATWLLSLDRDGFITGPMARYRYWISDSTSLDVGVGIAASTSEQANAPVFGLVRWNITPNVGLAIRPEHRRTTDYTCNETYLCVPYTRNRFAISAGFELSGAPGLVLSGAAATAFAVLVAIYATVVSD